MMLEKILVYVLISLALTGCAHNVQTVNREIAQHAGLSFLRNGETTKAEVLSRLGRKYAQFDGGRLLAYRLDGKYQVVARDFTNYHSRGHLEWGNGKYSLVLVFDENEMLQRHSLVRVR